MKNNIVRIVAIFIFIIIGFSNINITNADTGPKPEIYVHIVNAEPEKCQINLLDETRTVITARDLLWSSTIKDGMKFTYFGTPVNYYIQIIYKDEIKTSQILHRYERVQNITIDWNDMKILKNDNNGLSPVLKTILEYFFIFIPLFIITTIIELIVALIFKLKKSAKYIILANLLTQFIFYILMVLENSNTFLSFVNNSIITYFLFYLLIEIVITIIEYFIYKKHLKNYSNNKLLMYTFVANLVTGFLLDFWIPRIIDITNFVIYTFYS